MTQYVSMRVRGDSPVGFFRRFLRRFQTQLSDVVPQVAKDAEEYMQDFAPWEDQSGAARASLRADSFQDGGNNWVILAEYDEEVILSQQNPKRERNYSVFLEGYLDLGILDDTVKFVLDEIETATDRSFRDAFSSVKAGPEEVPVYPFKSGEPRDISF